MEAPTLDGIPTEVYAMILGFLPDRRDVNSLCKTSKKMYEHTVSCLYESISLYAPEEDLENIDTSKLSAAREKGLFRHTRDIKIWSHFYKKTSDRCMHMVKDNYDLYGSETQEKIAEELEGLLRTCEPGKIRSLDWSIGTCVPDSLLGPTGLLTLNQPNIESIRLVTDGMCHWNEVSEHRLALCTFANLKRLSWTGLSSQREFDTLADVLDQVSHQLEELEIDLTYHEDGCNHRDYNYVNGRRNAQSIFKMLGLSTPRSSNFPVLKRLALTAVPFRAPESDSHISRSFGFNSLQSLKLRNCDGWLLFFHRLTNHAEPLKLRSLELQCAATANAPYRKALFNVLQKTQGLEELFLTIGKQGSMSIVDIWETVSPYRSSLQRFVFHMVAIDHDWNGENYGGSRDLPDLGSSLWFPDLGLPALHSVESLDLTSLGICCDPDLMQRLVSGFALNKSLQVLHLRQSGKDLKHYPYLANADRNGEESIYPAFKGVPEERLYTLGAPFKNLAQWLFGPDGIRSLRLLAYGDFSGDGLFQPSNLLLCRRDEFLSTDCAPHNFDFASQHSHFREVRPGEDTELWELYEREKQLLEACPRDGPLRLDNRR